MNAYWQAGAPVAPDQTSDPDRRERPGSSFVRGAYYVEAGITSTAAGAWASSGFSGSLRAVAWIGITALLAAVAAWLADPALTALNHRLRR